MGFAVPEKAVIRHGDVVAHQDGAGSRQWLGWKLGRTVAVTERTGKQPVEFLGDRLGQAAVAPFLPRIGNAERQNVTGPATAVASRQALLSKVSAVRRATTVQGFRGR